MAMPCNKAGECVALEVFERKGGRDEIGQEETKTTKESIVCCASWPVITEFVFFSNNYCYLFSIKELKVTFMTLYSIAKTSAIYFHSQVNLQEDKSNDHGDVSWYSINLF